MTTEDEEKDKVFNITTRDWKWIVWILTGIIIYILTYKIWGGKSGNLEDAISIGSGLGGIVLAVIAMVYAYIESGKASIQEDRVNKTSLIIIENLTAMKGLINKLDGDNLKTHTGIAELKRYLEEVYIKGYQSFGQPLQSFEQQPDKKVHKDKASQPKKPIPAGADNAKLQFKRGDVFFADLSPVEGAEQGGVRPVVVIQNNIANKYSPTITVAAITAQIQKAKLPTHVEIDAKRYGFERDSVILLEHTRTIDKSRLSDKITHLDDDTMDKVKEALLVQMELIEF
jgi:mRNA-degrading endonuclease toxin of MazEF toxin-antitoxin module